MQPYLRVQSGLDFLDKASNGGLPSGDLNVISTSDDRSGAMVLGHYLREGLRAGERVALVTFSKASIFFDNFEFGDMEFMKHFEKENLFFLNYQPTIRQKITFVQNYEAVFDEIFRLCNRTLPSRIAFHQVDALLNISNVQLSHLTAEKFGSACKAKLKPETSVLAQFIKFPDSNHHDLAVALEKVSAGYFELFNGKNDSEHCLEFKIRKLLWFAFDTLKQTIKEERVKELLGETLRALPRVAV